MEILTKLSKVPLLFRFAENVFTHNVPYFTEEVSGNFTIYYSRQFMCISSVAVGVACGLWGALWRTHTPTATNDPQSLTREFFAVFHTRERRAQCPHIVFLIDLPKASHLKQMRVCGCVPRQSAQRNWIYMEL